MRTSLITLSLALVLASPATAAPQTQPSPPESPLAQPLLNLAIASVLATLPLLVGRPPRPEYFQLLQLTEKPPPFPTS